MDHVDAYPLQWPNGRPRTPAYRRQQSNFGKFSYFRAASDVHTEIERLKGRQIVISTDLRLRRDGMPYADQRKPDDPGVAVYFTYKGKQMCFACDRWDRVEDNLRAVFKTIEALRGIERWGSGDMMNAAFTGFTALPAPGEQAKPSWWEVLKVDPDAPRQVVEEEYRRLRALQHPDRGGDAQRFNEITRAWREYNEQQEV